MPCLPSIANRVGSPTARPPLRPPSNAPDGRNLPQGSTRALRGWVPPPAGLGKRTHGPAVGDPDPYDPATPPPGRVAGGGGGDTMPMILSHLPFGTWDMETSRVGSPGFS